MPNLYARQTALTNVGGRIDYISNPARQENLLAVHDGAADLLDGAFWRQLAQECNAAQKHTSADRKGVQGRELTIQLSNALLQRMTPEQIAGKLAASFEQQYHRPCMVALHMNKTETNLHAHLIYSERELLKEPVEKVAARALFFDESGKRCYKKAAVLDEAGELRPGCRIVAKGEIYERRCFGAVDPTFSQRDWLRRAKREWLLPLRNGDLKGDVEITEYDPRSGKLAQQHVGKAAPAETQAKIREYNQEVKRFNQNVDVGLITQKNARQLQEELGKVSEKNQLIRSLNERVQRAYEEWQREQQRRREVQEALAREQARSRQRAGRTSLDNLIGSAERKTQAAPEPETIYCPMVWSLQERIDQATGTDFAARNKARYYAKKAGNSRDGR